MQTGKILATLGVTFLLATSAGAETVRKVIDGDTIKLVELKRNVRLLGIDTPETFTPKCSAELRAGIAASKWLKEKLPKGTVVVLVREEGDEGIDSFGRYLATVWLDGENLNESLLAQGLARPYVKGKKINWCDGSLS